jgi:hypothetical protein
MALLAHHANLALVIGTRIRMAQLSASSALMVGLLSAVWEPPRALLPVLVAVPPSLPPCQAAPSMLHLAGLLGTLILRFSTPALLLLLSFLSLSTRPALWRSMPWA